MAYRLGTRLHHPAMRRSSPPRSCPSRGQPRRSARSFAIASSRGTHGSRRTLRGSSRPRGCAITSSRSGSAPARTFTTSSQRALVSKFLIWDQPRSARGRCGTPFGPRACEVRFGADTVAVGGPVSDLFCVPQTSGIFQSSSQSISRNRSTLPPPSHSASSPSPSGSTTTG